jgi:hypothetical protein
MLNPIFGGISGAKLPVAEYDLGSGAVLRATYAHVMAPFMMAFSPAKPGKHHPTPWSAVSGGLAHDVHIELKIETTGDPEWLVGTQALWWIVALMRLKSSWILSAPVFADRSFQEIPKSNGARLFPFEFIYRRKTQADVETIDLAIDDLAWVAKTWKKAAFLFQRERNFAQAFQAFDYSTTVEIPALALLTLWGALEQLFSPSHQELRFRVSALIACYVNEPGEDRLEFYKDLVRLYGQRSLAAHTAKGVEAKAAQETFAVMRHVLLKMISENSVPSQEFLEKLLFSAI